MSSIMAKSEAERARAYRQRNWYRQWPHLHPGCREVEADLDDTEWQRRCTIVTQYGCYPAPAPKPQQGKTPAEYQREYRKRARFKAAIEQIERLNTEQFQEDSYDKAGS